MVQMTGDLVDLHWLRESEQGRANQEVSGRESILVLGASRQSDQGARVHNSLNLNDQGDEFLICQKLRTNDSFHETLQT